MELVDFINLSGPLSLKKQNFRQFFVPLTVSTMLSTFLTITNFGLR